MHAPRTILTCAVTGNITQPGQTPHLPITPEQIADDCSLDLNTMNSGDQVVINTPANVRRMARIILEAGTKPELECFDSGDLVLAQTLVQEGTLPADCLYTLVTGVRYALPSTPEALLFARGLLPPGAAWSAFGIGRWAFPMVAQTWLLGGHVRIGLEDTIYLDKGVLAPGNAPLVARAREIVQHLGGVLATPAEARQIWRLREHN